MKTQEKPVLIQSGAQKINPSGNLHKFICRLDTGKYSTVCFQDLPSNTKPGTNYLNVQKTGTITVIEKWRIREN